MPNDKRKASKPKAQKQPAAAAAVGASTSAGDSSSVAVDRCSDYSSLCKWEIPDFPNIKAKALSSPYFEVGGFDFRFLMNPKGDAVALPGTISLFLVINNPRGSSFDSYACYRIKIVNFLDDKQSLCRENGYRFTKSKKSIGWSDFALSKTVLDPNSGFLRNGSLLVCADICILNDLMSVSGDSADAKSHVYDGKVTWTIKNFGLFKEMITKLKIVSPNFRVGEANFRILLYGSVVNGVEYLSVFLEVKETDKLPLHDRGCWCLFRVSLLNQNLGGNHFQKDGYGRFSVQGANEGDSSLGWNEFMTMSDFIGKGYLVEDTMVISVSFNALRDRDYVFRVGNSSGSKGTVDVVKKHDGCSGKFVWKIENFAKLKDVLKRKKISGLVIISNKFQIGNLNFRLQVYPRGQSQKPLHLSLFLEVWDQGNTSNGDSSCVFYRLEVVNHKTADKSILKESQNRYSKATKDWGWSEFMTLTSLFDRDSGYLDHGTVIFTADVRIMKETFIVRDITDSDAKFHPIDISTEGKQISWKVENILSLKDMMADKMATTLKICSEFFQIGGCKLRFGVYESSENVFMCLERDPLTVDDCDLSFWFRISVVNHKDPAKSVWKESSLCMKNSTNSNVQLMKVTDMLGPNAGFVVHDAVYFACDILNCCPELSKPERLALDCDQDDIPIDITEIYDSEEGKGILKMLLESTGLYLSDCDNSGQLLANLTNLMDVSAVARLLVGMRLFLDDPVKAKSLLCQDQFFGSMFGKKVDNGTDESKKNLTDITTGIKVLQQMINNLLLDILIKCCQPSNSSSNVSFDASPNPSALICTSACQSEPRLSTRPVVCTSSLVDEEFSSVGPSAVGCSVVSRSDLPKNLMSGQTSSRHPADYISKQAFEVKWPEPSEELLQTIVSSLKSVDGPVPQLHSEPMQRSQSAKKVFLLLKNSPRHLQADLVFLLPKLVNHSEHHLAASALLHQLQKVDAEPALKTSVLTAINRFILDNEVWELIFYEACPLLEDSNNEVLGYTIDFLFAAASHCQQIPQAARAIRARVGNFGVDVSPYLLDILRKTINRYQKIAEVMLREIDIVFALDTNCVTNPRQLFVNEEKRCPINFLHAVDESLIHSHYHFSDTIILIDMLATPSLAMEASHAFEQGIVHGHIEDVIVALVMERLTQSNPIPLTENCGHEDTERNSTSLYLEKVFSSILVLAETLSQSTNPKVHSFLKVFYDTQFGLFPGESYRRRMLGIFVDHATNLSDHRSQIHLDILTSLVHRECSFVGPIFSMMKDVAVKAKTDYSNAWHELCTIKEDLIRIQEEKQAELSDVRKEKTIMLERLTERLTESEATICNYKVELSDTRKEKAIMSERHKVELSGIRKEKAIMSERLNKSEARLTESEATICNYKSELKLQSDRFAKLSAEKKECLQQLSQKYDELKSILEENKGLTARIRNVEAERKRELQKYASEVVGQEKAQQQLFDENGQLKAIKEEKEEELARCRTTIDYIEEKLKTYASEIVGQEKTQQKLLDEIGQLKEKLEHITAIKEEKEEELAQCRSYIDCIEAKLNACQNYIRSLEDALREELSQHAPLYGVGLEELSFKELETLSRIHEEGLNDIRAIQQRASYPSYSP